MTSHKPFAIGLCAAMAVVFCAGTAVWAQGKTTAAQAYLAAAIDDPARIGTVLRALRATKDPHAGAILKALARSGQKERRLAAVVALPDLLGPAAAPVLKDRLWNDPLGAIQAAALSRLLELQAISDDELIAATTRLADENARAIAAGTLVQRGKGDKVTAVLKQLAGSVDIATASTAQVYLVALGQAAYRDALIQTISNPRTPDQIVMLVMELIAQSKARGAADLARMVAQSDRALPVRVAAYQAVSDVVPGGGKLVRAALEESKFTVFQVYLLRVLVKRDDARTLLFSLARADDTTAALARLELARLSGGGQAGAQAAINAMALKHPIVLDYVISAARKDVDAKAAAANCYAPALLKYIRGVSENPGRMQAEHVRAATAATILADMGTRESIGGLRQLLGGRYTAIGRSVAAGLMATRNASAAALGQGLLESAYHEQAVVGAMVLARFGDRRATPMLARILTSPETHEPGTVAMAAWYTLKLAGRSRAAAAELAKHVK